MDTLEIIMKGETERAIDDLITQAKADDKGEDLKKLILLKANLKKTKRDIRLGLITQEEYGVVFAKTNQYLIEYVRDDKLDVDEVAIRPRFKSIIKKLLLVGSVLGILLGLFYFYLRRDILERIFVEQQLDETYLLLFPVLLLIGSVYIFIKTRKHA